MGKLSGAAILAGCVALGGAGSAAAAIVNPGGATLKYEGSGETAATGTVYAGGTIDIPEDGVHWPLVLAAGAQLGGEPEIEHWELRAAGTGAIQGTLSPSSGELTLDLPPVRFEYFATGQLFDTDFDLTCQVGATADPVDLVLTTTPSSSPFAVPYDQQTGTAAPVTDVDLPSIEADSDCVVSGSILLGLHLALLVSFAAGEVEAIETVGLAIGVRPVFKSPVQRGTAGADVMTGTRFAEAIRGLGGNDVLVGLRGADRLVGGRGRDEIEGGGGKDVISGGPGKDAVNAGRGKDTLQVKDGIRETVVCGGGRDEVRADKKDNLVGCETVLY